MLRSLAVTVTVICVLAVGASAAGAAVQTSAGWRLDWPAATATVDAGSRLSIAVRPVAHHPRSRSGRVKIVLTRLAGEAGPRQVLTVRTVRRGTVRLTLPRLGGVRYALVASARGKVLARSRVAVAQAGPRTIGPGQPVPMPTVPVGRTCDAQNLPAAALQLDRSSGRAGDGLTAAIVNTGTCTLVADYPYAWERLVDGAWEPVRLDLAFIMPAIYVDVARSWGSPVTVADAATMPPGRYRVVKLVSAVTFGDVYSGTLRLTAEFDVLA